MTCYRPCVQTNGRKDADRFAQKDRPVLICQKPVSHPRSCGLVNPVCAIHGPRNAQADTWFIRPCGRRHRRDNCKLCTTARLSTPWPANITRNSAGTADRLREGKAGPSQ